MITGGVLPPDSISLKLNFALCSSGTGRRVLRISALAARLLRTGKSVGNKLGFALGQKDNLELALLALDEVGPVIWTACCPRRCR